MILRQEKTKASPRRFLSVLLGFTILAGLILPFAKGNGPIEEPAVLQCDLETLEERPDRKVWKSDTGVDFYHAETQNATFARSGKYCSAINETAEFGVSIEEYPVKPGRSYRISVWQKDGEGSGFLVVDGNWGLYESVDIPSESSNGWSRLTVHFKVPLGREDAKIKAYTWNPKPRFAYFDDFALVEINNAVGYELPNFDPSEIEKVNLVLSDNSYEKLNKVRVQALQQGLLSEKELWVKAKMEYQGQQIPCRIRLKGDWTDHLQGEKWSFRVELQDGFAWKRMVVFSFQNPNTRDFLKEWAFHEFLHSEGLLTPRYDFINLSINNKTLGVYAYEEHFAKQMIEYNQRREGPIVKFNEEGFWEVMRRESEGLVHLEPLVPIVEASTVDAFGMKSILKDSFALQQFLNAETLLNQYKFGQKKASEIFDLDKVAKYYAIVDVFRAHHGMTWHNQRFYYNPVIMRLEPIGFDAYTPNGPLEWIQRPFVGHSRNPRFQTSNFWGLMIDNLFADPVFTQKYIEYLYFYTNDRYITRFLNGRRDDIKEREKNLQREFTNYQYDWRFLPYSARRIRAAMLPRVSTSLKAHLTQKSNGSAEYEVFNFHCLPVEVLGMGKKDGTVTAPLAKPILLPACPQSNIADHFKMTVEKPDEWVVFRIPGIDTVFSVPASNWSPPMPSTPRQDLLANAKVQDCSYYTIQGKEIKFRTGKHTISEMMILPAGYTVTFPAGCEIDLVKKAGFLCLSPVHMEGSPEKPIQVYSSDKTGNAFTVLQADTTSFLSYVVFDNLNTLSYQGWNLTGATTFYESDVEMDHCKFQNNHCEDGLNIVRSKFLMQDCEVSYTAFDGFDCDFCKGVVERSKIYRTGNDGLDFSGSEITIIKTLVEETGDKGISVGEESTVKIWSSTLRNIQLGLASKDLSKVTIESITLEGLDLGFAGYQKKPEYGGGFIHLKNHKSNGVEKLYNMQVGSMIVVGKDTIKGTL